MGNNVKPSVEWALKKLGGAGLVVHEKYGDVDLTPEGASIADEVYRRHKALFSFLADILKVSPPVAEQDACKMEHALSRESINRLEGFIDSVTGSQPDEPGREDIVSRFIEQGKDDA